MTDQSSAPDFSHMTSQEIVPLMLACGASSDPTDRAFAKAARDVIAARKPEEDAAILKAREQELAP